MPLLAQVSDDGGAKSVIIHSISNVPKNAQLLPQSLGTFPGWYVLGHWHIYMHAARASTCSPPAPFSGSHVLSPSGLSLPLTRPCTTPALPTTHTHMLLCTLYSHLLLICPGASQVSPTSVAAQRAQKQCLANFDFLSTFSNKCLWNKTKKAYHNCNREKENKTKTKGEKG